MLSATNAVIILEYSKREKPFTEYEDIFARGIVKIAKTNPCKALTVKQEAIIDRIYKKCTGGLEREFHQYIQ